jgi:hypothetical protein
MKEAAKEGEVEIGGLDEPVQVSSLVAPWSN